MAYVDKAYYNSFTLYYNINHSIHEDTMSSHVIAKLEAQLAAAKVEALEAQLKAARLEAEEVERKHPAKKARLVSPIASPSPTSASASASSASSVTKSPAKPKPFHSKPIDEPMPIIPANLREKEKRNIQRLIIKDGEEPVVIHFRLLDATEAWTYHTINTVVDVDGAFGYMTTKGDVIEGLHSFEVMWHIRRDYPLSGKVDYAYQLSRRHDFHCLMFAYVNNDYSRSLRDIMFTMMGTDKAMEVEAGISPSVSPIHSGTWPRSPTNIATATATAIGYMTPPPKPKDPHADPPVPGRRIGKGKAVNASFNSVSSNSASNSASSNSASSNSASNSSSSAFHPIDPPRIERRSLGPPGISRPETVILAGVTDIKPTMSLSGLYKSS